MIFQGNEKERYIRYLRREDDGTYGTIYLP
jgi:hypothetical protein